MNFFGFGATPEIEIILDGQDKRKLAEVKKEDGKREKHLLYYDGESVSGQVNITLRRAGAKLEHQGIRIELIGQIELFYDRGNHYSFLSLYKELARPGELLHHQTHRFEFTKVAKPFETYTGTNCLLRYFLRVSIMKRLTDIVKEREIVVHTLSQYPDLNNSIKMEVGIEDCLHIEFEYNRSMYHLKDVIIGKIYFLLVRIKIKHMELAIIKRETTGSGPNTFNENDTLARFEIMDGAPVRGESIPIRLFLAGYDLTPTFKDVNRKFSVRYYLNLVLVDEEDRRYFKQQEIILWRKVDKPRKTFQASLQQQYRQMQNPNSHNVSPSTSNACRFNGQSASSSNGSVSDAVASTSSAITANDQDRVQVANPSALKENKGGLHRDMATLEISNGKNGDMNFEGDDDITDGRNVSNGDQKYSIPLPKKSAGDMQQKKMENGGGNSARLVGYQDGERQSPFSAGASKTLSGDDSDDDTPKLTGSICQADVHNMSHELAVDAAAIVGEDGGKEE